MAEAEVRLADLAEVIRSKNAGPFELTLDVFFRDGESFRRVRDSSAISRGVIADLYGVSEADVLEVTFFEPAGALKITLKRWVSSAAPGDTDVFGAQQHVPLMNMRLRLKG